MFLLQTAKEQLFLLIEQQIKLNSQPVEQQFWLHLQNSPPNHFDDLSYAVFMSDFLLKVLKKQPHFLRECLNQPFLFSLDENYTKKLQLKLKHIDNEEKLHQELRQFRNIEMAKLSIYQSLNLATVEDIFIRLSELAEALIITARDWLYNKACEEMGTPVDEDGVPQQLYILGMGKLGGFELNFSSDIDLIFTYPSSGQTIGGHRSVDNQKFFTRLGQKLIKALDDFNSDGFVYRTDMRLRPFGDNGALVLSFNAMESYYQEQGRDWERYAMIKGRILGDDGQDPNIKNLYQLMRPFVYRRYIDFSVIQSLREMKSKITREIRRRGLEDNIKLGTGGIREIEFIVQAFQLIRGGREKSLQQHQLLNTLVEIEKLGLLPPEQTQALRQAYLFLRRVENILQAIDDKQTQILPIEEKDRLRLIHSCSKFTQKNINNQIIEIHYPIQSWQDFCTVLQEHQQKVRLIFSEFIGNEEDKSENNEMNQWQDFLDITEDELDKFITDKELSEDEKQIIFDRLAIFRHELQHRAIGPRGRTVLNQLLPILFEKIFTHENSIQLLSPILNIIEKVLTRTTYLELLLEHPQVLTHLLELCSRSKMIAEQVANYPILLDELLNQKNLYNPPHFEQYSTELQQYLLRLPQDDEEQFINGLRQFKQTALLRIAAADILGVLPLMKVSDHLTYLAEAIIDSVVNLAWKQVTIRFGTPENLEPNEKGFLAIGYGKLGGIELGYQSDLDLVFLYNGVQGQTIGGKKSIDNFQFYLKLSQKIVSIFSMNTNAGILYDVDLRLRPSGEAGLLCNSLSAFEQYLQNDAWTWEKQALVRARVVFGENELQQQFSKIRAKILSSTKDLTELKHDICEMRAKMYQHLANKNDQMFNLKTDKGGITDIEFIAQYLVLAHSQYNIDLAYWSDNVRIFDVMATNNVISLDMAEQLKSSYTSLRTRVHQLNLLGLNAEVNPQEFQQVRSIINNIWEKLLIN